MVDIPDVVTYANFGDHRLRGFWVAGGQISPSPIDFHRRPYNTLALPCERVIKMSTLCRQQAPRLADQTAAYWRRPSRPNRPNGTSTGRRQSTVGMGESSWLTTVKAFVVASLSLVIRIERLRRFVYVL